MDKVPLTSLSPMQVIHCDLFKYMGKDYMSICDQVSTYTFLFNMKHTDTREILEKINDLMMEYGNTKKIVSDGASNFTSQEFADYCSKKCIVHQVSSPYNPSSNSISKFGVKKYKFALCNSQVTDIHPQHLLNMNKELVLSDCNISSKSLFLKRRISR